MVRLTGQDRSSAVNVRFELGEPLGEGANGVVYSALDRSRDCRVALKKLRNITPEAITRLKREFRALENLQHPNLVTLHELFEEDGEWFFTMELVEGVDFSTYVRGAHAHGHGGADFDEARLRSALAQLSSALNALHAAGKIHRDVKPSNALVTAEGRLLLLDFGLVADVDRVADWTAEKAVGTVRYMAPEQAAGRPVGPEADWYAVGTMLYEVLTARRPFEGTPLQVLIAKQRHVPDAPAALCSGIPADLSELCMDLMRIEPARRPSGSSVVERMRAMATNDGPPMLSLPPPLDTDHATSTMGKGTGLFVGREPELAFLAGALTDVRRGEQVSVYLQGESGIGKSELIRAFAATTSGQGIIHLRGRCYERETVAYKAVDGVMEDLASFMRRLPKQDAASLVPRRAALLLRVFPALTRVSALARAQSTQAADPQEQRTQLFETFRELFLRLCERYTVLITIDDLQWSDGESLAVLSELLRKPGAPPLLFIGSWRSAHTNEVLGVGLDALPSDARSLQLERLSGRSACELAEQLLAQAGGDLSRAARVAEAAGGHPILVDELARFTTASSADPGAVRVEDALWSRIAKLEPGMRKVLEIHAIAGTSLSPQVVAQAIGLGSGEQSRHVASLRVHRLLRTSTMRANQTAEIYHDSVRRAVLEYLDAESQRALHAALARALQATGKPEWEALATHHLGAGDSAEAAACLLRAADQAEQALAFGHAVSLFDRMLALWPADHPERQIVLIRKGDALSNAGRGLEAARAYSAAIAGADGTEARELRRRAAQQLLLAGRFDEGVVLLEQVLATEGITLPRTPARALASILYQRFLLRLRGLRFRRVDASKVPLAARNRSDVCWRMGMALGPMDPVRGQSLCTRALFEALRTGDAYFVARAIAVYAAHLATGGTPAETRADRLLDMAHALASATDSPHALGLALASRGQARYLCGKFRAAVQYSSEGERLLRERCVGVPFELDTARLWTMRALVNMGEYAEVSVRLPAMLDECRQRDDLYADVSLRSSVLTYSLLALDRPDEALAEIAAAERRWSPAGYHMQHFYLALGKLNVALYQGLHGDTLSQILEERRHVKRSLLQRVQSIRVQLEALRGRAALASAGVKSPAPEALRMAEDAACLLAKEGRGWAEPQAQLLRAGILHRRGRPDGAVAALRNAMAGFEQVEMRVHAACAGILLGRFVAGSDGHALVAHGLAVLETQRVAAPERLLDLLAPGFGA
jgi:serine/threonine protein kinase/tetratricopeptide (TPR) repeat protein